jgi:DNA-binding NtrC family response regulator
MRGGGIGRGDDNLVHLSDPAVSRLHSTLELRDRKLVVVDAGSRNQTLVNGQPIDRHTLAPGDVITVGATRLSYLPEEIGAPASSPSRVTIEVSSRELLAQTAHAGHRARRHLAALASFGDQLHGVADEHELARAACQSLATALRSDRAFLVVREQGRLVPTAASVKPDDPAGQLLAVPADLAGKVLAENKALAAEGIQTSAGERAALAAPLAAGPSQSPSALLYADQREGSFTEDDLMAMACLAHLLSASFAGLAAQDALAAENRQLAEQLGKGAFVGQAGPASAVLSFIAKVGPSDATVLITGESGAGKEMVARGIHQASRRRNQAFVAVNCAALTESLIESELFGHEKGAFTGATERKIGRFEAANRGTLFLDEVGELPLSCQTKFLRVLEEQCFDRVGGTTPIHTDVRVVAATNRNLPQMVQDGRFRQDLYYRLSVIHTVVPSLRERPDDIPLLAEHFLQRLRSQVPRRIEGFADDAMDALSRYSWPGNVRELRNAIERAIVLGEGERIRAADLPPEVRGEHSAWTAAPAMVTPAPSSAAPPAALTARPLKELEREGIVAALQATGGNKAQAAALLEIDRSTLYKKIKDYGID